MPMSKSQPTITADKPRQMAMGTRNIRGMIKSRISSEEGSFNQEGIPIPP